MWIRVQNQEALIEAKFIYISKGLTKKSKATINARISGNNTMEGATVLGEYDTVEEGKRIFEAIQDNIVKGTKLYIMP